MYLKFGLYISEFKFIAKDTSLKMLGVPIFQMQPSDSPTVLISSPFGILWFLPKYKAGSLVFLPIHMLYIAF